ncbi:MAG: SDR family oxidoreductase [Halobacteriota archaeon]|uniref:SDR family oxidoreductase n=1 Tax=Natronomonas sp. TaxID=2184060 RepID=UPI003975F64D
MDTAVITGASRGIGRAVAATFARRGVHVVACARDREPIEGVATEIEDSGGAVTPVRADVRDEFDVERLVETAARAGESRGIDCVVANAGVYHGSPGGTPLDGVSYSAFDDTIRTNVRGVFSTIREAIPHLTDDARVLVPSGSIAREPLAGYGAYAVSKAGAEAIVRQFAADASLAATVLDLGQVATELTDHAGGRTPEDIAPMFWWAATEADADTIRGTVVEVAEWRRQIR